MEVNQEDNPDQNCNVQPPPSNHNDSAPASTHSTESEGSMSATSNTMLSVEASASLDQCVTESTNPPTRPSEAESSTSTPLQIIMSTTVPTLTSISPSLLQDQQSVIEGTPPVRAVDRNWARVRQKVIGNDSAASAPSSKALEFNSQGNIREATVANSDIQRSADLRQGSQKNNDMRHVNNYTTDQLRTYPLMSTESSKPRAGVGVGVGAGPVSTGIRGVLGFRTVVVQRTQLRKMEKEIEKALLRHANEQIQPRSRTVPKIGTTVRGARGVMPGGSYSIMPMQEPSAVDKSLIDDIAEILNRWKGLTVEVPCRIEILQTLARMLQIDSSDSTSRIEPKVVLSLFNQMRYLFPLQNDSEDLTNLLWCLELLSPKYACRKDRVITIIHDLLRPKVLLATLPLSPKNIQLLLAKIVMLMSEQSKLASEKQDHQLQLFLTELMTRMRTGDLGLGKEKAIDPELQEHNAKITFLQGLIGCLCLQNHDTIHFLIHEIIPNYWIELASKYPLTMNEPVKAFGQAASDIVLKMPIAYEDRPKLNQSLVLDLVVFLGEFIPPTSLGGSVSNNAIATLVKFILSVFSMEYIEDQQQDRQSNTIPIEHRDEQTATPRASISTEIQQELISRTPPRSPLSPNVSGENFHIRSLPPHVPSLIAYEMSNPVIQRAREYFNSLWDNGYQGVIIDQLKVEKIVVHQPEPNERLSSLLLQLSVLHRTAFFKPMIACVASDSTQFVTDYLCILSCLETHMSIVDLYMRDPDMICIIAMTDVGPERPRIDSRAQELKWGSCTVGQCVIVLEFIYAIKRLARSGDKHQVEVGKMFLIDLERKLGMFLVSKEKKFLVPRPMRVMLCMIFYEIRMLCKTIHRPGWLPRILNWAIHHSGPSGTSMAPGEPYGISETMRLRIKHIYLGVDGLVGERKDRYTVKLSNAQKSGLSTQNPNGSLASLLLKSKSAQLQPKRLHRMPNIGIGETVAVLRLLISVHSIIHRSEYFHLLKPLWDTYCLESHPKVSSYATFLFVKCADIDRESVNTLISRDLKSDDSFKRVSAIERLGILFSHRNELLQLPYVNDPSSRGPFRSTNTTLQIPFVSSEIGSNRYTMDEPRWLTDLKNAGNFPTDIRLRFEELSLGEKARAEKETIMRIQTPLMLSWTGYLDEDFENKSNFGRTFNVQKDRHATIIVPAVNDLNLAVIDLLDDNAVGVRAASVNFLSDYIRNEPVLFVRSLFAEVIKDNRPDSRKSFVSRIHLLLSASSKLPPGFAFALFNHLFGLLKWYQKNSRPEGMEMMALLLPLLADIVSSTNDIVYKDFKRNKVDLFIANMGRFWFRPDALPDSMFPSHLADTLNILPRLEIPRQLFQIAVINVNQIQFTTSFLARYPFEVEDIKNSIGRFSRMPRLDFVEDTMGSKLLDSRFLPDESKVISRFVPTRSSKDRSIHGLSSLRARAWLCFVINLIQRMEKVTADRVGLTLIFNGVNSILLEHGDDFGIIGQALDIYVTAATHLRHFFASQNGYSLIFPILFKIYCDTTTVAIVQDAIDAAFYRFYLLHQEAFILQSLGVIVPLMLRNMRTEQSDIMTRCLYSFFEALDQPKMTHHSKALGVQSLSEPYHESSTYGGPQLEIPDWMSSFIPKDSKLFQSSNLLHKREFSISDSIKLFLAVIAFDPGSIRSEQFVRVLRQLLPYFLDSEPELMSRGLDSLIEIFSKFSKSSRPLVLPSFIPPEVAPRLNQGTDDNVCHLSRFALCLDPLSKSQAVKGKTWAQNDRVAIKHEFVCLIETFCDRGGQLADSQHQQMAVLIRSIVKDYTSLKIPCTTEWIKDYIKNVALPVQSLQQSCRAVLYLVFQFSHALRTHYKSIDFSGFLEGLVLIANDDRRYLRSSPELANMIRDKIINPALGLSVKSGWITDSVHISQTRFCNILVELILSMIKNANTDTISELEQATPTPRFMAYIIIPICLRFKSHTQTTSLNILEMQFWLRMLGLAIKAVEYDPTMRRSSRMTGLLAPVLNAARVNRKRSSFEVPVPMSPQQPAPPPLSALPQSSNNHPQTPGPSKIASLLLKDDHTEDDQNNRSESTMNASHGLMVDFIALRIIMVRGERYLSFHPGCWLDIFNLIKKYFWGHAFIASSFSGAVPSGHDRHNGVSGSGPPSPNITNLFPASPRSNAPMTPDHRQFGSFGDGSLSPFPGLFRSANDVSPFFGSGHPRENVPTTALGYIMWSLAETVVFNRLPLMIMMRPFLTDQLRMQDKQPQIHSGHFTRSTNSSGQNSPAFYWPSPAMLPTNQSVASSSASTCMSPVHPRSGSGVNSHVHDLTTRKQQREERRKQWKSWSKPEQTMNVFIAGDTQLRNLPGQTSPHHGLSSPSYQRQRSFVSAELAGGSPSMPRTASHHSRSQHKHLHSESESRSERVLPKVLVDHANKSMEHVRSMMGSTSSSMTTYSELNMSMYPEKRPSSTSSLSPSMARLSDRRESSHIPQPELVHSNSDQFLLPGKYERQPSSPGFGSMFLAREAAFRSTLSPPDSTLQRSHSQPSLAVAVPGTTISEPAKPTLGVITNEKSLSPKKNSISIEQFKSTTLGIPQASSPSDSVEQSIPVPIVPTIVSPQPSIASKKRRSNLKPTIITTGPPKADSTSQIQNPTALFSGVGAPSPSINRGSQDTQPIQRVDGTVNDGDSTFNGSVNLHKCQSISKELQEDARIESRQSRTKKFIQNIEEETRLVLASFPSVFAIGPVAAATSPIQQTETVPTTTATPTIKAVEESHQIHQQDEISPSASTIQQSDQAHGNKSSLIVPMIKTPSIAIQDHSYLAPSPINPLPSALDGEEHLFLSSLKRTESSDAFSDMPYRVRSLPPSPHKTVAKENRRKSVIFQNLPPMINFSTINDGNGGMPTSVSQPTALLNADSSSSQIIYAPPKLSITLSSPPIPSSASPPPLSSSTTSQNAHIQNE
ncbi:hypothetical protein BGZ49_009870 [Haplosporangium sp. Z 27]|nr:hypothetical protein BGZ49_009870 [Haplosporangium sp. Z 27]